MERKRLRFRESFVFYSDFFETLFALPDSECVKVLRAIREYMHGGDYPLEGAAGVAFIPIRQTMDRDNEKFEKVCEQRSIAGKRSSEMRRRQGDIHTPATNVDSVGQCSANATEYESETVNESEHEEENEHEDVLLTLSPDDSSGLPSAQTLPQFSAVMRGFNTAFAGRLPQVKQMSTGRRKAVKARLEENGVQSLTVVMKNVSESQFLQGKNDHGWRADFDWIFRPANYLKILEGNYNNNQNYATDQQDNKQCANEYALRQFAEARRNRSIGG
jgi:hypothetical protein